MNKDFLTIGSPRYKDIVESKIPEPAGDGYLLAVKYKTAYLVSAAEGIHLYTVVPNNML